MKKKKGRPRRYRRGAGAMLFNGDGKVFVGHRSDTDGEAWQMPQGGIEKGEKPRRAALRELAEEIGTDKFVIIAKSSCWLTYDFPKELAVRIWNAKYRGQKQRWFALGFTGVDGDIDLDTRHPEFDDWKWADIETLPDQVVPFKRRVYEQLVAEFRHLAVPRRPKRP